MKCTHQGRQTDGSWCIGHEYIRDGTARFNPPQDVVAAVRASDGTPESVRRICPDYYTPLECVKVVRTAGLSSVAQNWRSYEGGRNET